MTIRVILLMAILVIAVNSGAGADIFVRQAPKEDAESSNRSIYIPRFRGKTEIKRQDRRPDITSTLRRQMAAEDQALYKTVSAQLKMLDRIKKSGREPETAQELATYAAAYRAQNMIPILKRRAEEREAVLAREAERKKTFEDRLAKENPNFRPPTQTSPSSSSFARQSTPQRTTPKRKTRRVYTPPSSAPQKPRRVFRDYR